MKCTIVVLASLVVLGVSQTSPPRVGAKDLQFSTETLALAAESQATATNTQGLFGMAADNAFVFIASKTSIVRMDRLGLSAQISFEVPLARELAAIQVDQQGGSVYATGDFDEAPHHRVVILDKDLNPSSLRSCALPAQNMKPWAMGIDEQHIYTSHNSKFLTRLDKLTCDTTGAPLTLELPDPNDTADVRSLEVDPNAEFLFANTHEMPARVIKVNLNTFSVVDPNVDVLALAQGQDNVLAGAESDAQHVFVSTTSDNATKGATVIKISKSNMQVVDTTQLEVGEGIIAAMDSDALSVYITTANDQQPRVLRLNKETMKVEDRLMLSTKLEKGIVAITHSQDILYVGAGTTPATFVELNSGSFYVPKDCELGEWGDWSNCIRPWGTQCGTGLHNRSRSIAQQATPGGTQCANDVQLKEVAMCDLKKCAEAPHRCPAGSGEIFRTDSRMQFTADGAQRRTCSVPQGSNGVLNNTGACDCPEDKQFWHEISTGIFRCVSEQECAASYQECSHSRCSFVAGRVKVFHHNDELQGGGIKCVHDTGRTGGCHCYCGYKASSPSDLTNENHTISMLEAGHPNHANNI